MHHDQNHIVIIGSGLASLTLACALAPFDISLTILTTKTPITETIENYKDERSLALSHVSHLIFSQMTIWSELAKHCYPIKKIHISDKGHFGFSRLLPEQLQVPALGYVIPIKQLQKTLFERVSSFENINIISALQINEILFEKANATLSYQNTSNEKQTLKAPLMIIADGGKSNLHQQLNIEYQRKEYNQSAIVANVGSNQLQSGHAYERFTEYGAIALLPLGENRWSLVWTVSNEKINHLMSLDEKSLLAILQKHFGYRAGRFTWIGTRQLFPLTLSKVKNQIHPNLLLLGNACHNLHPIAGQGFNLTMRDISFLAKSISEHITSRQNLSALDLIQNYEKNRRWDQNSMISLTDSLISLFNNEYKPISLIRNIGILGMDFIPGLKTILTKRMMGYHSWI
ncbi:MAG: FAD-dependent monooxygenase [Gammaproteobacteria bacterium]